MRSNVTIGKCVAHWVPQPHLAAVRRRPTDLQFPRPRVHTRHRIFDCGIRLELIHKKEVASFSDSKPYTTIAQRRPNPSFSFPSAANPQSVTRLPQQPIRHSTSFRRRDVAATSKCNVRSTTNQRRSLTTYKDLPKSQEPSPSNEQTDAQREQPRLLPLSSRQPKGHQSFSDRLPNITQIHRPSREELLAAATGFWSRLKVRFKWFSIRSARPFNADEIGAFFSWVLLGHVLWIVLGTTTFFSLAIFAVNTVFAQETLARWVGNYLTKSSGIKIVFESAIVPKWGDGVITFKNVFVSRRPGQGKGKVSKGSPGQEAAAVAAAIQAGEADPHNLQDVQHDEDINYTQFDLSLDTVNVTLSFRKWFNSKGLLRDVEVKGVRGVIDRTSVLYTGEYVDPRSYKHEHNPGDFEMDSFKMEDLLVTVHQPGGFRPFSVSIYNCELPKLRRQWLFYDFLSASVMSGSFDESLFTIHPAQVHGYIGGQLEDQLHLTNGSNLWKKQSRLRVVGLNIDHLNRGVEGPFSWIHQGSVDIIADIKFPADADESITKIMSDFYERMEAMVTSRQPSTSEVLHHRQLNNLNAAENDIIRDTGFMILDLKMHLNDVRAAVPIFTKDLSYVNNALIRPIVAYMNSQRTFIPINCRVIKRASEFDGSWTIFDSGLMDDMSRETYTAFATDVADDHARLRRFKKVGLWSLQLAAQAFFMGLAGNHA